jgi:hypothetical protein
LQSDRYLRYLFSRANLAAQILLLAAVIISVIPCGAVPNTPNETNFRTIYDQFVSAVHANDKNKVADLIAFPVNSWSVSQKNLGKYAEKTAQSFLATRKGQKYQGSVDISVSTVTDAGVVNLTILGQGTSGDHKGDVFFSLDESVRVRETPSGLRLETVGIHTSPEN